MDRGQFSSLDEIKKFWKEYVSPEIIASKIEEGEIIASFIKDCSFPDFIERRLEQMKRNEELE